MRNECLRELEINPHMGMWKMTRNMWEMVWQLMGKRIHGIQHVGTTDSRVWEI